MEPVAGRKLGRYTLTRRLGAGGMAEVWEATDGLLRRRVAVKIVRGPLAESAEFAGRFLREARLAAQLQHAGIVAVYDVGLERESLFVVMPVLSGGTLADRLASGRVRDDVALSWLATLASALDYAHGRGVVHRDVKPLNVLFDEAGAPHLADFGLARGLDEATQLTQTGVILGTPLYMSPEQAMGTPAGPAADQYSLGVLAYRLLAGRLPFEKEPTPVLLRKTAFEEMPPPSALRPDLPPAVDAVFTRVLAKAPELRHASCSAFAETLAKAFRAREVARTVRLEADETKPEPARSLLGPRGSAPPDPPAERRPTPPPPPPVPSRPRRVPASVVLLGAPFAILLGVAVWIVLRPSARSPETEPSPPVPSAAAASAGLPRGTTVPDASTSTPFPEGPVRDEPPAATTALTLAVPTEHPAAAVRSGGLPPTTARAGLPELVPRPPPPLVASPAPTATPAPARFPGPAPTSTPMPAPTPTPGPTATATPGPSPSPRPAEPTPTEPPAARASSLPGDPLADVPRRRYPPDLRVKDAWVELEKMGSHTLHFRFTDDLEGRGESVGWFGTLAVATRGDAPLLPGARSPLPLVCSGLDGSRVKCLVPAPDPRHAAAAPRLAEGDRVLVRAVLAGFSFSATLRFED